MTLPQPSVDVYRAVADPTRRAILDLLTESEQCVSELCLAFPISQPAVTQHLRVLEHAGLTRVRSSGRLRYYRLRAAPLAAVHDWVSYYEQFWPYRLRLLEDVLERRP
jgi:DNA-binding transcriptional ArsR family regulator